MIKMNALAILLICCFVALGHNLTTAGFNLSAEEDENLKRQLQMINKPSVTKIQTKYGDWYHCVNFYEQPAFDHPLLRDHKYEYKMSSSRYQPSDKFGIDPFDIWLNGKGCPTNTVPIKRVTKEDLIKINKATESAYTINSLNPGVAIAVLKTADSKHDAIYYRGGMSAAIYHPDVGHDQYSSSRMSIESTKDNTVIDRISVGWTVNPSLYPHGETHLFIYTSTNHSYCYNTYCPGYIIMSPDIPPDVVVGPYPVPNQKVWELKLYVRKDAANGNWFLNVGDNNDTIGTWPQTIFSGLADFATDLEWGGEVYSPPGTDTPVMGAGTQPEDKPLSNCFIANIRVIAEDHKVYSDPQGCVTIQTSDLYEVSDYGDVGSDMRRTIYFGGKS
ncbi:hypothetical protein LINPERHAP2_LOCUS35457 [Linum perenne]